MALKKLEKMPFDTAQRRILDTAAVFKDLKNSLPVLRIPHTQRRASPPFFNRLNTGTHSL